MPSTKVINLLPKSRQQELRYLAVLHSLWVVFFLSLGSVLLVIAAKAATKFYLQNQSQVLTDQIVDLKAEIKKNENPQVKAQVKVANDLVSDYRNLAILTPKWSKVIKAFVPLPPPGVKINTFIIDPVKNSVNITGFSPTRELVIQLYDNIKADTKNFHGINYPLENVARPEDINFYFNFLITEELLK